ncbi:MAG: AMP-binding protein, partial [bacterium]|nr:AMP-binding protein [bacterium]
MNDPGRKKIIEDYWMRRLAGEIPQISLPVLDMTAEEDDAETEQHQVEIPGSIAQGLFEICKNKDMAVYIFFLCGLDIALYKYTGIEDILVGTVTPKKEKVKDKLVLFREKITPELTFKECINQVKTSLVEDLKYSDYSFGMLYQKLLFTKGVSSLDIFNAAFIYDKIHKKGRFLNQFNLVFTLTNKDNRLTLEVDYNSNRYTAEIVNRFCRNLISLFDNIPEKIGRQISQLEILSKEERQELLFEFNETKAEYPENKTIHKIFEEAVERTPENKAVVYREETLTYKELNREANAVAAQLRQKGIKPGKNVAILLERSLQQVTAILGILKAGGAYLPIAPDWPQERVNYMLRDSSAACILSEPALYPERGAETERIDMLDIDRSREEIPNPGEVNTTADVAYIIYTSGTTGKPKGVMIEHRGVINMLTGYARTYEPGSGINVLHMSNYTFDPSIEQIFGTLLYSATLHIGDNQMLGDPEQFYRYLEEKRIHIFNFIPVILNDLLGNRKKPESLRVLITGGDKLEENVKNRLLENGYDLYNHYGPTEATVEALTGQCTRERVN